MGSAPDASADGGQDCITSHVEAKGLGASLFSREKFGFPVDGDHFSVRDWVLACCFFLCWLT